MSSIWVRFQREGIHKYPAAKDIAGVEFLQYPHRHIFHFSVEIDVFHQDRDIEFVLFKREMESLYDTGTLQLDYKSCEMMANDILDYVTVKHPGRDVTVSVSEDDENGARVTYLRDTGI